MRVLLIVLAVLTSLCAEPNRAPRRDIAALTKELDLLKGYLESARDSLQTDVNTRWTKKQRYINQRETDKEELAALRSKQEQVINALSTLKEECFAQESKIEEEKKNLAKKKDEWTFFLSSFEEVYEKEENLIDESIPLDMEKNRAAFSAVQREYQSNKKPAEAIDAALGYYFAKIDRAGRISIGKELVLPDEGDPTSMNTVRFGDLFAYAFDSKGRSYSIRQTGRMGLGKYSVEPVGSPELAANLQQNFPKWYDAKSIGAVTFDILQNQNSELLLSGKKVSFWTELWHQLKEGGMIMIPILLLPFWVLWLTVSKYAQLKSASVRLKKQFRTTVEMISAGNYDGARKFAEESKKGFFGKMINAALERRHLGRDTAERAVYEIVSIEAPRLNRNLNTIAVIAGAAPLLGLLGTISGMITLFAAVTHSGTGDPKALAGGISEALITAKTGLAVAIPSLFIHDMLRGSKDRLVSEMEEKAMDLLHAVFPGE